MKVLTYANARRNFLEQDVFFDHAGYGTLKSYERGMQRLGRVPKKYAYGPWLQ